MNRYLAITGMLAVLAALSAAPGAHAERGTTSGGSLEVLLGFEESVMTVEFLNPSTGAVQVHVDYTVHVSNDGTDIFGPIPLTHTSTGKAHIPVTLGEGTNDITVTVQGILFIPIEVETLTLQVSEGQPSIPSWIKASTGWWVQGEIDDATFLTGIQFLIDEGIMVVQAVPGAESGEGVPDWVKTTAGWWVEGFVSNAEFVNALKYLIEHGVLVVGQEDASTQPETADAPDEAASSAAIPSKVRIGGVFDRNWAEGDEGARMAMMAVDDFNRHLEEIGAGWTLSMSVEDAQSQGAIALEKIQAFNSVGVDILVGVAFSSHINLAASYIDDHDILVLSHGSQATNLAINDSIFRLVPNDGSQAPAIVRMLEDAGIKVLVTIVRGDTWGDGLSSSVAELFSGTTVDAFRYNPDVSEFSVEVSLLDDIIMRQVEEHGAESVGVLYVGSDEFLPMIQGMRFYENLHGVRWFSSNTQSFKSYFLEDPAAIKFAEATRFTATRSIPASDNHIKDYVDAQYMEKYDAVASTYGYAAYDSVWLLGMAILHTQSTDTGALTEAIPQVAAQMLGASGNLTLTEYGDLATAKFEVWQVADGDWIRVDAD